MLVDRFLLKLVCDRKNLVKMEVVAVLVFSIEVGLFAAGNRLAAWMQLEECAGVKEQCDDPDNDNRGVLQVAVEWERAASTCSSSLSL